MEYVTVVSNNEIALIHGGDESRLKSYLKELWKKLSDEHKLIELSIIKMEKEKKKQEEKEAKEKEESGVDKEKAGDEETI